MLTISNKRIVFFLFLLIASEFYQYFILTNTGLLSGDFSMTPIDEGKLTASFFVSVSILATTYFIFKLSKRRGEGQINISANGFIISIYFFNLFLSIWANVGNVLATSKSPLSFLTTLLPINYLILVNAREQKLGVRFFIISIVLVVIDLYRLLLGAIFKIAYIFILRSSRKVLIIVVVCLPLLMGILESLVKYKFESRGAQIDNVDEVALEITTSRISTISTVHYMLSNSRALSKYCSTSDYASPWLAAALSIIPKAIFGLEYVKTYNNCIIEYHLGTAVSGSSVNAPWLMTLYIEYLRGPSQFFSYFVLTFGILFSIIKLANKLLGSSGDIFKFWVIFEFNWTGNILHLTIPLYFLVILWIYVLLRDDFIQRKKKKFNLT